MYNSLHTTNEIRMKLKTLSITLVLCLWAGWGFSQSSRTYHLHPNSQLNLDPAKNSTLGDYSIGIGDRLVFEFVSVQNEPGNGSKCPEILAWEVEAKGKRFSYSDGEISTVRGHYGQLCQNIDRGVHPIEKGTISGEQMKDGNWKVNLDVEVKGGKSGKMYRFKFEEIFEVK